MFYFHEPILKQIQFDFKDLLLIPGMKLILLRKTPGVQKGFLHFKRKPG